MQIEQKSIPVRSVNMKGTQACDISKTQIQNVRTESKAESVGEDNHMPGVCDVYGVSTARFLPWPAACQGCLRPPVDRSPQEETTPENL
jgi:hypothetical protein